ncbi:MAG TPA: hypothetical protein VJV79_29625 [Polyangiaceae bacterium]|nr:hypothetical protein [Polyangiaceae bacterium]
MTSDQEPFKQTDVISQPGIIGASWWRESLANTQDPVSRRSAIKLALGVTGSVVGLGALLALAHSCSDDGVAHSVERKSSLEMQRSYGWSFGAASETVTFDGASTRPFERSALTRLATDLRPSSPDGIPYYAATLFESLGAVPLLKAESDPENIAPLEQVVTPIHTPEMDRAYAQGRALAKLLSETPHDPLLVIVDLDGPSSVAFAAGASVGLSAVFAFGNWPHPRGVVKAHRTLAAAVYYQPLFAQLTPSKRPLLMVLDRQRLATYSDDATQFDNRYTARVPDASVLANWGVRRVLYVTPSASDVEEAWDLTADFSAYVASDLDVKLISADAFSPDRSTAAVVDKAEQPYYYGGRPQTHGWFWRDYPWARSAPTKAEDPGFARPGTRYRAPAQPSRPAPLASAAKLGTVPVGVSLATGAVLGAMLSPRSGSWNRSDGSGGG